MGQVRCRQREIAPWQALLKERPSDGPLVPCRQRGHWVRPELYCQVRHFGWTAGAACGFPHSCACCRPRDSFTPTHIVSFSITLGQTSCA